MSRIRVYIIYVYGNVFFFSSTLAVGSATLRASDRVPLVLTRSSSSKWIVGSGLSSFAVVFSVPSRRRWGGIKTSVSGHDEAEQDDGDRQHRDDEAGDHHGVVAERGNSGNANEKMMARTGDET
jgi:hypothetical protein